MSKEKIDGIINEMKNDHNWKIKLIQKKNCNYSYCEIHIDKIEYDIWVNSIIERHFEKNKDVEEFKGVWNSESIYSISCEDELVKKI